MGDIIQTPIIGEVEQSFLDYSLSVITDRAIPSAEDGLKPVARRILWDMFDKGYRNDKKFVKCAQPVGDTMGRFHPHGDSSIYGALVWLSQPWNTLSIEKQEHRDKHLSEISSFNISIIRSLLTIHLSSTKWPISYHDHFPCRE